MSLSRTCAQAGMELRLLLRNPENLLVTLAIPVGLLAFFARVPVLDLPARPLDFLAPGVLALGVMSTGMVSLAIATGFERSYLVLKRLGATPLRRSELIAAKIAAVLAVEALQVTVIVGTGVLLGWQPVPGPGGIGLAALSLVLGTAAFAGLGLAMAGRLRATATLALANGLFLVLLLCSGLVFPLEALPAGLARLARWSPAAGLADVLRAALGPGTSVAGPLVVLTLWALAAPVVAMRVWRWE